MYMSFKTKVFGNEKDLLIRIPHLDARIEGIKIGNIVEVNLTKLNIPKKSQKK